MLFYRENKDTRRFDFKYKKTVAQTEKQGLTLQERNTGRVRRQM
jgi:hypothetical protein